MAKLYAAARLYVNVQAEGEAAEGAKVIRSRTQSEAWSYPRALILPLILRTGFRAAAVRERRPQPPSATGKGQIDPRVAKLTGDRPGSRGQKDRAEFPVDGDARRRYDLPSRAYLMSTGP